MFECDTDMFVELFSVISESNAFVGAFKQSARKLFFEVLYSAGEVRLIAEMDFRGSCEAFEFCHMVENAVVIVTDLHDGSYVTMVFNIYRIYILHIFYSVL